MPILKQARRRRRNGGDAGATPYGRTCVLTITERHEDGGFHAVRAGSEPASATRIAIIDGPHSGPPAAPGDRVLARILDDPAEGGGAQARIIRTLKPAAPGSLVGVLEREQGRERAHGGGKAGLVFRPADRRQRGDFQVAEMDLAGARPGDIVLAEAMPGKRGTARKARVRESFGSQQGYGLLSARAHDIPPTFPEPALQEAERASAPDGTGRVDLRQLPFVTVDGPDAKDFDDAVWAAPDGEQPGGWHIRVAIADVAWFVRPHGPLDQAARERGNSSYFPDRALPMLPPRLSSELCALRPWVDRAALVADMRIDGDGQLREQGICRALVRSVARLTYGGLQAVRDGKAITCPVSDPIPDTVPVAALYDAFHALRRAREDRGALDLDVPEMRVDVDDVGRPVGAHRALVLDSHRLIEEFMIAANVAAARVLEAAEAPVIYRIHAPPGAKKMQEMGENLRLLGVKPPGSARPRARDFSALPAAAADEDTRLLIAEMVLRAQSKAVYSADNIGHFGLGLARYCHFTSPIRRYADLLVHWVLISACNLGSGGLPPDGTDEEVAQITEHLTMTERRSNAAEWSCRDRCLAALMAQKVGEEFTARIVAVRPFALFVRVMDSGAEGMVPARLLPGGHVRRGRAGGRRGSGFSLGDTLAVRLLEARPVSGTLLFAPLGGYADAAPAAPGNRKKGRKHHRKPPAASPA